MQRQQPIAGPAARESEESCSVSNWYCFVYNSSFGTYTSCAQHANSPRCNCYQISQGQAGPQLVHTVFRAADRNVGGQQQVSAAAEVIVKTEDAAGSDHDAPNPHSKPPNEQARKVNFNAKTVKFASKILDILLNKSMYIFF